MFRGQWRSCTMWTWCREWRLMPSVSDHGFKEKERERTDCAHSVAIVDEAVAVHVEAVGVFSLAFMLSTHGPP